MEYYKYLNLIWQINMLLDTGKFDDITVKDVKDHIEAGTISSFMIEKFGDHADFSILNAEDWLGLTDEWANLANAVDESRKMGLRNRGLCLLLGYSLQCYQTDDNRFKAAE